MEKKLLVVLMVVGLCSTVALALDPMGPPTAGLKQGQANGGLEYSYSDMDLKLKGGKESGSYWSKEGDTVYSGSGAVKYRDKILNARMNKIYANLGYGIMDNWEAFIRLGGANGNFDYKLQYAADYRSVMDEDWADPNAISKQTYDLGYTFAYGFGTKVTFFEQPDLKWGGLFQMSWANWDIEQNSKDSYLGHLGEVNTHSEEISLSEIQLAIGPTWTPSQGFSVYGGPFLHFVYGDVKSKGNDYEYDDESGALTDSETWKGSFDIREKSCFGGYVGAVADVGEKASLFGEVQFTGDAWALGAGLGWKF